MGFSLALFPEDSGRIFLPYSKLSHIFYHWRRLVKNIGWANQNIGGAEGGKR